MQQLTHNKSGHTLHNTQCFSPDDQWVVFDSRNYDTLIQSTGCIAMVNVGSGEIQPLYHTRHQTRYGPGVGAATFSPTENRVLFIHGIRNSDKNRPYSFTRRTGVAVDVAKPNEPVFMDARNITPPFTPGALRGGTHAHSWSPDGKWISFTYNDFVIHEREKKDSSVKDLRTVGVMVPGGPVIVPDDTALENNKGEMFSVVVAKVKVHPAPGSDEIEKAFDEGWIGKDGYLRENGSWQRRALAFQGNVIAGDGTKKTEVFILDLPEDVTQARPGEPLQGTVSTPPNVPLGVIQRRITHLEKGISGPRHWLRSTPDGRLIGFLMADRKDIIQVFGVSPNGGEVSQLTFHADSVQGPFNFSPDGAYLAYFAGNSVHIASIKTQKSFRLTPTYPAEEIAGSAVIWSNDGDTLVFNKYVKDAETGKLFLQVFKISSVKNKIK